MDIAFEALEYDDKIWSYRNKINLAWGSVETDLHYSGVFIII